MKYFTYDLISTMNHGGLNREIIEEAEQQWNDNGSLYWKSYKNLINRLPTHIYNRFIKFGFHDYELEKLTIDHISLFNTNIDLILTDERKLWKLSFDDIQTFKFKHLYQNSYRIFAPTTDSWLQEEFLSVDDETISFEVLFSSGANIQIYFKDKNIKMEQL
ncbi:hypothetical protein [Bacillus solimangrovi]|uniref:Uncharacterized protein n=1 Tax=Bacillus solimangrovi TaxID=1305675 RepID=A0A1E5LJ26_9BACI|nr:hypothetical protein [Bacillus solimangrovi]OEH94090.1 hypothetical protein BFG57_09595 [Bacillus solimangrovi]